ncbi:MAG: sugar-binding transcriptional regulator [Propionicimonas sp.]
MGEPANDLDLMIRAAWFYYGDGLTQAKVAQRLFVSRQTVGRLLEAAREHGIVRIEIDSHFLGALKLATRLRTKLGLQDAVVVPGDGEGEVGRGNERVAAALAAYVRRYLHPGAVVGLGWGDTVARALSLLPAESLENVTLASVMGGVRAISESLSLNAAFATHLRAVPAPLLVSSKESAQTFMAESAVRDVLNLAASASVTVTGIGSADPATSSAARSGVLSAEAVATYAARGAVGDMLGEWYDTEGRAVSGEHSDRRIGLSLDEVRAMPNVVGAAGGVHKVDAIRGAAAGRLIKVLITDEPTAEALLQAPDPWTIRPRTRE